MSDYGIESLKVEVYNTVYDYLQKSQKCEVLGRYPDTIICICSFTNSKSKLQMFNNINKFFIGINRVVLDRHKVSITAGISANGDSLDLLPQIYKQARIAEEYSFIAGKGKLVRYENIPETNKKLDMKEFEKENSLRNLLRSMNIEKISGEIDKYIIKKENIEFDDIKEVKILFQQFYFTIVEFVYNNNIFDSIKVYLEEFNEYARDIWDLDELNEWLKRVIGKIVVSIDSTSNLIQSIKACVNQEYSQNITLSDFADKYGFSLGYISRVFLEEVGCNFIEYRYKVRMEAAMDLLKNNNMKIYEIAKEVGYTNSEHFSKSFKKYTGKSPKEYKNRLSGRKSKNQN